MCSCTSCRGCRQFAPNWERPRANLASTKPKVRRNSPIDYNMCQNMASQTLNRHENNFLKSPTVYIRKSVRINMSWR